MLVPTISLKLARFLHPTTPRGTPMKSAQGVRSTTEGEIFKGTDGACADPDTRIFPATRHKTAAPSSSFIQAAFTSHTGSLLLSLYAPRYCLTASAGFGRQFTKLRALSRLRRRYDSRKKRIPSYLSHPSFPLPHFLVNIRWRILTTRTISGMLYMLQKC